MSEMKHDPKTKHTVSWKLAIPFFLVLTVLTVLSFCIPLRPTESYTEKRKLAEFPEFSWETLISGDYFDDITLWFSDTFPGRESWISLSSGLKSLHGHSDIAISGVVMQNDAIPVATQAPEEPSEEPSETAAPTEAEETEAPETEPTEPEPTEWGGIDAGEFNLTPGAVIQIGDSLFNSLGFSKVVSDEYIDVLNKFAAIMSEKDVNVVSAPPPTAIGIMIEGKYLEQLNCAKQDEIINYLHGSMTDDVIKVDTYSAVVPHNSEYIYFRTDHHWTALGAYYSYRAVCEALGYTPAELSDFEVWDQGEFIGSLGGQASRPNAVRWDNVYAYVPQGDIDCIITDEYNSTFEGALLADMTNRNVNEKYLTFLSGDDPITQVINHDLPDAPNCVVVKDSFGNCFVPFLSQNYHNVYAIDYRKYGEMNLQKFCEEHDIDDVIVMPYLIATQSMLGYQLLGYLFGVQY